MKIAIVKLSALGDIIHAMVALQFIKKSYPDAIIDWVVEAGFVDVLNNNPDINQIHSVNLKQAKAKKSLILAFKELKKVRSFGVYDLVIDAQGLVKSAIIAKLMRSKQTWGFDKYSTREPAAAWFYSNTVAIDYAENSIDRNVRVICKPLNIDVLSADIINKAPFLFFQSDIAPPIKPYIVFVIGSTWESRNYPKNQFVEIAQALKMNCMVAWGNDSEKNKADWMCTQSAYINALPKLNLEGLKCVIQQADLLIGNDTGPTHMAWGLNTASIVLFGPTPVNRVYETPINKVLASNSKVDHFNLDKQDYSIAEIPVKSIINQAKELLLLVGLNQ